MTNTEYQELKKQEYMNTVGIVSIDDDTNIDIKKEWFARLNQIKSGHLMNLTHEQIDLYCVLEGYEKREFVKSCVYEGIDKDILAKIIVTDNLEAMKELKREYYKSDYILDGINNKVNTLYGALDDCEQKFGVFEKYLEQFSSQVNKKEDEISSLKAELDEYRIKIDKLQEENNSLKLLNTEIKAQNDKISQESKPREVVVTRIIKEEKVTEVPDKQAPEDSISTTQNTEAVVIKEKKNILSGVRQLLNKNIKVVEDKEDDVLVPEPENLVPDPKTVNFYKKQEDVVTVYGDIEEYILKSKLTSEQLLEISKCFVLDISDEQIIAMIENNYTPSQIKNIANVIVSKRNAEKRKMEQLKEEMAKSGAGTAVPPQKLKKSSDEDDFDLGKKTLSEMFGEDNEEAGAFADEYNADDVDENVDMDD